MKISWEKSKKNSNRKRKRSKSKKKNVSERWRSLIRLNLRRNLRRLSPRAESRKNVLTKRPSGFAKRLIWGWLKKKKSNNKLKKPLKSSNKKTKLGNRPKLLVKLKKRNLKGWRRPSWKLSRRNKRELRRKRQPKKLKWNLTSKNKKLHSKKLSVSKPIRKKFSASRRESNMSRRRSESRPRFLRTRLDKGKLLKRLLDRLRKDLT